MPWGRKIALARATSLLVLARAALVIIPFERVARIAEGASPRSRATSDAAIETTLWAIRRVGDRLFPANPCLPQAIVAQRELRRAGRPAVLRISVRKDRQGRFGAHAWVESEDRIVIGGEVLAEGFVALPSFRAGEGEE